MGIDVRTLPLTEQIFTWVDPDGGKSVTFAVNQMLARIETLKLEPVYAVVPEGYWETLAKYHGVSVRHAMKYAVMLAYRMPVPPCVTLEWPGGTHLMVDGSHRAYAASRLGRGEVLTYVVPPEVWQDFVVDGLPNISADTLLGIDAATGLDVPPAGD